MDVRTFVYVCVYECMYLWEMSVFSSRILYLGLFCNMNHYPNALATDDLTCKKGMFLKTETCITNGLSE